MTNGIECSRSSERTSLYARSSVSNGRFAAVDARTISPSAVAPSVPFSAVAAPVLKAVGTGKSGPDEE